MSNQVVTQLPIGVTDDEWGGRLIPNMGDL
jgi:hypothetical protein